METQENILPHQSGSGPAGRTRIFAVQNLELAAGAIEESLCRIFERVARFLMAYGDGTGSAKKEAL